MNRSPSETLSIWALAATLSLQPSTPLALLARPATLRRKSPDARERQLT